MEIYKENLLEFEKERKDGKLIQFQLFLLINFAFENLTNINYQNLD
jgi:hypothetical protein